MKLLKQKGTGDIFVWTEHLATRDDMEEFARDQAPAVESKQAAAEINPSENCLKASEDEPNAELAAAKAAFRKQASKVGRKPAANQLGES